uniref:Olfactory receptor n=1 Tax=Callorhinus ursinus TaxID=34884 RepID=A0A3Q7PLK0_CALUR|nr:olfactory receptor 5A1-like [Callorhinus ursinus]
MAEQSGFFTWIFAPQESPFGALLAAERRSVAMGRNISMTTNFILLGFSEHPELQVFLFVLFLGIYSMTLAWNLGLIVLIRMESCLHSPMYFFLGNLSFVDISYTSSIAPKMLCDFFKQQKTISFVGCAAQFFFFIAMGGTECCLLAAMAYDRYAAISNPLLYTALMSPTICLGMVITAYTGGLLTGLVQTSSIFQLHFCGPRVINHFFCDLPPLLVLSCSSTFLSQIVNFLVVCAVGGTSALVVLVSYGYIIAAVMKIHSTQGQMKAFNTCASHLTTVILFYGSGLFSYLHSSAGYSQDQDKVVSMFYGAVIPMLNPIIYSLRNKEIKDALKKLKDRKKQMSSLCLIVP